MDWSPQQAAALDAAARWLDGGSPQVFKLWGFAGTGKTTLARHLAEGVGGLVLFGAFTGKAAYVMRRRGCPEATTIHSLIYRPVEKSRAHLRWLSEQLKTCRDPEVALKIEAEIAEEQRRLRAPAFDLDPESKLRDASLLIVDECSMVGDDMGRDLLSFGIPILVLGDPFQLPPVFGQGYFTTGKPDVMLTEVHRQARDDPIVHLATSIREGHGLDFGKYGESSVIPVGQFDRDAIPREAQVIVGKNETRRRANARRRQSLGLQGHVCPGDRVVCLRNDHKVGLLNGGVWDVREVEHLDDDLVALRIADEERSLDVTAHAGPFRGEEVPLGVRREAQEFDHGWALTCHKAQGSEWRDVVVVDEAWVFRDQAARWRYTAVTRASERVTVVRSG